MSLPPGVVIDGRRPPLPPATVTRSAANRVTVRALRVSTPLNLDGRLDEAVYLAPPISGLIQTEPDDGQVATEETEAWVSFDEENVYVSARVWDSAPESEWIANEMRRNGTSLRDNDSFGVVLDTFYDRRNGYFFYTNALGARADRYFTDEGNNINRDLLPVWDVRTGRFDGGWTVKWRSRSDPCDTGRERRRSGAFSCAEAFGGRTSGRTSQQSLFPRCGGGPQTGTQRVSMAGTLVGVEAPPAARNLELMPYGIYTLTTDRMSEPEVSSHSGVMGDRSQVRHHRKHDCRFDL